MCPISPLLKLHATIGFLHGFFCGSGSLEQTSKQEYRFCGTSPKTGGVEGEKDKKIGVTIGVFDCKIENFYWKHRKKSVMMKKR